MKVLARRFGWWAAVLSLALVVAACGRAAQPEQPSQGGQPPAQPAEQVLRVNLGTEPPSLDPAIATDTASFSVINAIFEGLTRRDASGAWQPAMATEWSVSEDGLTYTFKLRDGITWSNGDPVTAHDFEYAWKRAVDPRTASEYAYQLYYLVGAEEANTLAGPDPEDKAKYPQGADDPKYKEDYAAWEKQVDEALAKVGVKALDDKTLEVKLKAPTPYFLELTAFPTYFPVNRRVVAANPKWAAEASTIVSNGPFVIAEWKHENEIVLRKNPSYWDAASVRLDKIVMPMITEESTALTAFENDELDVNGGIPSADIPRLLASGEAQRAPYYGTYYLSLNMTKDPLKDVRVRQALSYAIDRKAIVENVTKGGEIPAFAFVPPGSQNPVSGKDFREEAGDLFSYDPAKAKQLLAEAGYPDGQGFPKLVYSYNESETHKAIAEAIQQMWKQTLGIQVELQVAEWKVHLANMNQGNYQIARIGWIGDYLDPMTFMDLLVTGGGFNRGGYSNAEYDRLIKEAKETGDQQVRMANMHRAEEILMQDMPIIPIYFYVRIYQEKPYVKGILRWATGVSEYKWAYVEK